MTYHTTTARNLRQMHNARRDALGRFAATERFPTLAAYWRDPVPFEAERAAEQAKINASLAVDWDAHWRRVETNDALELMALETMDAEHVSVIGGVK